MSINNATISGHLTRDAESKQTSKGLSFCTFTVAVNERKSNSNGDWEDYPSYIKCTLFGARANALWQRLTKGTKVMVSGKLHQNRWQDSEGKSRSEISINIDEIDLPPKKTQTTPQTGSESLYEEDIPF